MNTLTLDDYRRMSPEHQRAFDAWLSRCNFASRIVTKIEWDDLQYERAGKVTLTTLVPSATGQFLGMGKHFTEHHLVCFLEKANVVPRFVAAYCGGSGGNGHS